jgi:hypothetical protein
MAAWPAGAAGSPGWTAWTETGSGRAALVVSAVTGSGPGRAWAFGADNSGAGLRPAAWRLAGSAWVPVPFPGRPGETVTAAASFSPASAWAFTSGNRVLRWNGRAWRAVSGFPGRGVSDAVATGPADLWVFAQADAYGTRPRAAWHYDGQTWTQVRAAAGLGRAAAIAPASIWAFGGTRAGHWDGSAWTTSSLATLLPRATQYCGPQLTDLYAQSATSAWAVGWQGCQDTGGAAVLLRDAGGRWRRAARLGQLDPVAVLPGPAGGAQVLAAPDPQQAGHPVLLQYAGGRITTIRVPLLGRLQVWSATVLPRDGGLLVVGTRPGPGGSRVGVLLRYRG